MVEESAHGVVEIDAFYSKAENNVINIHSMEVLLSLSKREAVSTLTEGGSGATGRRPNESLPKTGARV